VRVLEPSLSTTIVLFQLETRWMDGKRKNTHLNNFRSQVVRAPAGRVHSECKARIAYVLVETLAGAVGWPASTCEEN
jgi:hypothetical protein